MERTAHLSSKVGTHSRAVTHSSRVMVGGIRSRVVVTDMGSLAMVAEDILNKGMEGDTVEATGVVPVMGVISSRRNSITG